MSLEKRDNKPAACSKHQYTAKEKHRHRLALRLACGSDSKEYRGKEKQDARDEFCNVGHKKGGVMG